MGIEFFHPEPTSPPDRGTRPRLSSTDITGKVTEMRVPFLTSLSIWMEPPWRCTTLWDVARPRPSLTRVLSRLKCGTKKIFQTIFSNSDTVVDDINTNERILDRCAKLDRAGVGIASIAFLSKLMNS